MKRIILAVLFLAAGSAQASTIVGEGILNAGSRTNPNLSIDFLNFQGGAFTFDGNGNFILNIPGAGIIVPLHPTEGQGIVLGEASGLGGTNSFTLKVNDTPGLATNVVCEIDQTGALDPACPLLDGVALGVDDLTDAAVTTPAPGEVLTYTGSGWANQAPAPGDGGAATLNELTDVTVPAPAQGEQLINDGGVWKNTLRAQEEINRMQALQPDGSLNTIMPRMPMVDQYTYVVPIYNLSNFGVGGNYICPEQEYRNLPTAPHGIHRNVYDPVEAILQVGPRGFTAYHVDTNNTGLNLDFKITYKNLETCLGTSSANSEVIQIDYGANWATNQYRIAMAYVFNPFSATGACRVDIYDTNDITVIAQVGQTSDNMVKISTGNSDYPAGDYWPNNTGEHNHLTSNGLNGPSENRLKRRTRAGKTGIAGADNEGWFSPVAQLQGGTLWGPTFSDDCNSVPADLNEAYAGDPANPDWFKQAYMVYELQRRAAP